MLLDIEKPTMFIIVGYFNYRPASTVFEPANTPPTA